jgi:acetyl esterase/lipase
MTPMTRVLTAALAVLVAMVPAAGQVPSRAVDAAFAAFFEAATPEDIAAAVERIMASGVGFDDAFSRLKKGRAYAPDVPRGVVQGSHRSGGDEFFYTLDVPEDYDPTRQYPVRVQLHGGVGRSTTSAPPRVGSATRMTGAANQIYVMPYAWRDAPWWTGRQVENIRAILDHVKRTYNVDENRVVVSGVSDGGTGAYYLAMRDTTPFASVLPLNGFLMVLRNETTDADGDLFPNNLRNKPLFVVNGGRDPLYPTSLVGPVVEHLKAAGVDVEYRPQATAGHDTSWWPEISGPFEEFAAAHPRQPLPDTLTWEAGAPNVPARAHWLVIERLTGGDSPAPEARPLPDVNRMPSRPALDFGIRGSGTLVNRVARGSNAEALGLRAGDVIVAVNNQRVPAGTDLAGLLQDFPAGRPLLLTVTRGGESVRVNGRYAPTVLPGEADLMFPPQNGSGRVDLTRTGNRIEAATRGVEAFTLLLSPDQFDLDTAVTVVVDGKTIFEGKVQRDVRTLLTWAARDNDRTMLFEAALRIGVPRQ